MLLTLNVSSLRSMLVPRGRAKPKLVLADVPTYAREEIGLHGLNLATDLLAGATRETLELIRDRGDKAGCACILLSETEALPFGAEDDDEGDAAIARMIRVVQAASLLGCNSASLRVGGKGDEESIDRAAERLKDVVDRAERLEVNVLIAPAPGMTEDPDRLTDLVKKVGGFRIGTLPDFADAAAWNDPVAYLHRITPYASVVNASTVEFAEPTDEPEQAPPPTKKKTTKKADAKPSDAEKADDGDESDDDAEAELAMLSGDPEARLLAELESMLDDEDLDLPPPPEHIAYDLRPLISAIVAVGYDGTLALDYRGKGDATLGLIQSRDAIDAVFDELAEKK